MIAGWERTPKPQNATCSVVVMNARRGAQSSMMDDKGTAVIICVPEISQQPTILKVNLMS